MTPSEPAEKKSKHGVSWFALLFLIPGLGVILGGPVHTFYLHLSTADWVRVPGVLEQVNLLSQRSKDSTTHSVHAAYHYDYNGHRHYSSRVGYDWSSDNLSDYQQRLVQRLELAQSRNRLRVWVNPDNPAESFLVRELRWKKMGFMTLFGGLFTAAGLFLLKLGRSSSASEQVASGEPILSSAQHGHWLFGFMAITFLGLSLPGVLAIPDELEKNNWPILVVLMFPLAGLWLGWMSWKSWRSWKFFGPAPLYPDPAPGQIGGDVGGRITLSRSLSDRGWKVTLQCLKVRTSRGRNRSRNESLLWQEEQVPEIRHQLRSTEAIFRFTPPDNLPTSHDQGNERIVWRLLLSGPDSPAPLGRTYELPVTRGSEHSTLKLSQSHLRRQQHQTQTRSVQSAAKQIEIRNTGGGLTLHSRALRNLGLKAMLMIFGLAFSGISVWLWQLAVEESFILYPMAVIFGMFGFPMALGGLFVAGRSLNVRIEGTRVTAVRNWCGLTLWQRKGELTRPDQLVLSAGASMTQGQRTTEYFTLELKHNSRSLHLAEGIAGRPAAEALREELIRRLRLS